MKITIITVVYNGEMYIKETIESVIKQTYKNIEYIIIDGGSTDRTKEIVQYYSNFLYHWRSEPDENMYDAINKGLSVATGEYILCINSDDQLYNETTISKIVDHIKSNSGYIAYYGNVVKLREGKKIRKISFQCTFEDLLYSQHCSFIPHPALIISKKASQDYRYDTRYHYASDYEYILNLARNHTLKYIPIDVTLFREHPKSITSSGKINPERLAILRKFNLYNTYYVKRQYYFFKKWIYYKILQFYYA